MKISKKAFSRVTLKKRSDFLKAAKEGRKVVTPGFILQILTRSEEDRSIPLRFGFTATRKIGSSVIRNRAKRRLRSALDFVLSIQKPTPKDYVLIARQETVKIPFEKLLQDFKKAFNIKDPLKKTEKSLIEGS